MFRWEFEESSKSRTSGGLSQLQEVGRLQSLLKARYGGSPWSRPRWTFLAARSSLACVLDAWALENRSSWRSKTMNLCFKLESCDS